MLVLVIEGVLCAIFGEIGSDIGRSRGGHGASKLDWTHSIILITATKRLNALVIYKACQ